MIDEKRTEAIRDFGDLIMKFTDLIYDFGSLDSTAGDIAVNGKFHKFDFSTRMFNGLMYAHLRCSYKTMLTTTLDLVNELPEIDMGFYKHPRSEIPSMLFRYVPNRSVVDVGLDFSTEELRFQNGLLCSERDVFFHEVLQYIIDMKYDKYIMFHVREHNFDLEEFIATYKYLYHGFKNSEDVADALR